jgi:hypothetical protein
MEVTLCRFAVVMIFRNIGYPAITTSTGPT